MERMRTATAAFVAAVVLALAACASGAGEEPKETEEAAVSASLLDPTTFTICYANEPYPPMSIMTDPGNPEGFDPALVRAVAERWGVEAEFQLFAFDGLIPGLVGGRCDAVWSALYLSEERLEQADGVPYLLTGPGLIVPAGNPQGIASIDDLAGKTVAVQTGGANIKILEALNEEFKAAGKPEVTISGYPKVVETVAAVVNGKADALIETDVAVADIVASQGGQIEEITGIFPADTNFGVYVQKGSALKSELEEAIRALIEDGTAAEFAEQYSLDPAKLVVP